MTRGSNKKIKINIILKKIHTVEFVRKIQVGRYFDTPAYSQKYLVNFTVIKNLDVANYKQVL